MATRKTALRRAIALGLGLCGLAWAIGSLELVFLEERDTARASIAARARALEAYAHQALTLRLRRALDAQRARIAKAEADPLAPAQDLLLVRGDGEQILPRRARARAGEETPARALYEALLAGPDGHGGVGENTGGDDPVFDGPFGERVALFAALRRAVGAGGRDEVEAGFRAILAHRTRYRVAAERDIPYVLALLDDFTKRSRPDRRLLELLIREGVSQGDDGLERALLRARDRFSAADFAFLSERTAALAERGAVRRDDFLARVAEDARPVVLDRANDVPYLSADRRWYVAPTDDGVMGVRVDLAEATGEIASSMRRAGLLATEDSLALDARADATPLAALRYTLSSPRAAAEATALTRVYWLKTLLSLAGATLAIALVALVLLLERRERRWGQLRADFVAAVSHELRTPLASIRLQAETLARRLAGSELGRDYPARIVRDVDGLSFLVENILSFNRIGRDGWAPQKTRIALSEVIATVLADARQNASRKLTCRTEGIDAIELDADPELLRLLFANLVRNALQYNEREPVEVELCALVHGGHVDIRITDNGIGMARESWESVFEDFHREARDRARGSGLGLAICRRVAHAHGGSIHIERSGACGTTFHLQLPLGEA